jgi:biopolymer transport protein ExbD
MADVAQAEVAQDEIVEEPVIKRRKVPVDNEMDITPMIDCTFQLLIFFLVCSIPDPQRAIALPPAVRGIAVNPRTAAVVTIVEGASGEADVYLSDGRTGTPLPPDAASRREAVLQYFQESVSAGKTCVLIKAEGKIKASVINTVAVVAGEVEGIGSLHFAVAESRE